MDVVKTLRPGRPGTHRFLDHWGNRLVAVRYRKSRQKPVLYTTIEIIVDERAAPQKGTHTKPFNRRNQAVALRVDYREQHLRQTLKAAGARWSPQLRLWLLRYNDAVKMGLADRIVEGAAEACLDVDIEIEI